MATSRAKTDPPAAVLAGVGEYYHELHAGRRGNAAADEAMLRAVPFIRKLGERAHFSQDRQGTRIILERVTQSCGKGENRGLEH